ncbi:MORN repeat-containing protein [Psychroflexus aestuariivivens]|uniref:MORN repeat-containing protein n=1 Tax=Psychroflexus aestuariivivens TaxID=1795040 RepID=UPI0018654145|nr:hypothetical protein [Psychroflexus aestuariivivens]
MSEKSNKQTKKYRLLFFVTLFLLITIVPSLIWLTIRNNSASGLKKMKDNISQKESEIESLNKILKADAAWIYDRDLEKAIYDLKSIEGNSENENIQNRISALQKLQYEFNTDSNSVEQYRIQIQTQEKSLKKFETERDSLQKIVSNTMDSIQKQSDSMIQVIEEKKQSLARKNDIQVISFKSENGDEVHYLGEVHNGKANGGGIGIWRTGSIYRGEWKNNKRHGKGTFEWADGQKYEGDFENDIRSGAGIYYWPSGERYEGEFENNRREGYGTLYDPDGNISFEGDWKNDKPVRE